MQQSDVGTTGRRGFPTTALRFRGVTRRFGPVAAITGVDLTVCAGEIVGLVGENGAGKSTVVECAAGVRRVEQGLVEVFGQPVSRRPLPGTRRDVGVVWQDHGLCGDLDVVANVFLGDEPGGTLLAERHMAAATREVLARLGRPEIDVRAPADELSRADRQVVALARVLVSPPRLLILDEPLAALDAATRTLVATLLRDLRNGGTAVLIASHDLDDLRDLADRLVVLRTGRVVARLQGDQVHRDEVLALMSGIGLDAMARHQLTRLQSMVDQLSSLEPTASLALILSAMAAALDQDLLCLHLREDAAPEPALRRVAAVGLPSRLRDATSTLRLGEAGGAVGRAVASGELVVVDEPPGAGAWGPLDTAAAAAGIRSMWAAPIVGRRGVLGAVSGYAVTTSGLRDDRREVVAVYAGQAAGAIEREQLLAEVTRRNDVLESLRAILERLAGPERREGGLTAALLALCDGLHAAGVAVHQQDADGSVRDRVRVVPAPGGTPGGVDDAAVLAVLDDAEGSARRLTDRVAAAPLRLPEGPGALVAWWVADGQIRDDRLELIDDARRSLALALEREALEHARREAVGLRRSQTLQRELLSRLSHELRTPLTAIHGYASTLRQPDLSWDAGSVDRFLAAIADESGRMERLVGDLLDSSAIESGLLRLQRDWCDLPLVLDAARRCLATPERVTIRRSEQLEPVWGDHDRLEQVFVNLLENAVRYGDGDVEVAVAADGGDRIEVLVTDHGPGIPPDQVEHLFRAGSRGATTMPGAGLGLSIARGIVEAHGGRLSFVDGGEGATFRVALPTEPPAGTAEDEARWELIGTPEQG